MTALNDWLAIHKDALQALGAVGFLLSACVAMGTFAFSTYYSFQASRRAELTTLAKMYADWNAEIVKNDELRKVLNELIWDRAKISDDQVKKIHFLNQCLSILLIDWNIGVHYRKKSDVLEAKASIRGLIGGINEDDRRFFVENFEAVFLGYPVKFKCALYQVLGEPPITYWQMETAAS